MVSNPGRRGLPTSAEGKSASPPGQYRRQSRRDAAAFRPAWWLPSRHAQTIWPALIRAPGKGERIHERFELVDGDFIDGFWGPSRPGPIVLLLHGLGGCASSGYILGIQTRLARHGYQTIAMNYRGTASQPNRLPRFYHAGDWRDPHAIFEQIQQRLPERPRAVVGFSLGAAIAINWLGTLGEAAPVEAAVAVSVPFDLEACASAINQGVARLYQWDLLNRLKWMYREKYPAQGHGPITTRELARLRSLRDFDAAVTAPLHGFANVADYYQRASPGQRIGGIRQPTLIVQARDDPFIPASTLPATAELPAAVTPSVSAHGGHVGFVSGPHPWRPNYWAEQRILDFLNTQLAL